MSYSEFMSLFREDKVAEFSLDLSSRELSYTLRSDTNTVIKYVVPDSSLFIEDWKEAVKERDELINSGAIKTDGVVKYDFEHGGEGSWLISLLPSLLMIAIIVVGMVIISRKMNT